MWWKVSATLCGFWPKQKTGQNKGEDKKVKAPRASFLCLIEHIPVSSMQVAKLLIHFLLLCFVDPNEEITEVATPVNPATELLKQGAGKQWVLFTILHLPTIQRVHYVAIFVLVFFPSIITNSILRFFKFILHSLSLIHQSCVDRICHAILESYLHEHNTSSKLEILRHLDQQTMQTGAG